MKTMMPKKPRGAHVPMPRKPMSAKKPMSVGKAPSMEAMLKHAFKKK